MDSTKEYEELRVLLENDYPRFTVADLIKFVKYIDSDDRWVRNEGILEELPNLFLTYHKYDVIHFLHAMREGKI